ncbi:MAG: hypothetical protein JXM70_10075 [Pirellulales bacterium]|nr:hypothetical protein [Pirellulales bacterium]
MQFQVKIILSLLLIPTISPSLWAAPFDPDAKDYTGNKGKTIYVSKLGDNSDGSTWAKAFNTIQTALLAVPDDKGGHKVVIRPDTYAEANLYPSHKGAAGSYNLLVADVNGRLGSGATGWVVIDSGATKDIVRSDPKGVQNMWMLLDKGDPEKETGMKSVDWWGPWRCSPHFSGVIWDRWIYRGIYGTGCEGGIGWDITCEKGAKFSAIVEDCVGIGRFCGAGVGGHVGRKGEPIIFRRSYFMCLDWWGDAAGAYVRGENPMKHDYPDAVFEDCILIGPDNALQSGNPGFDGYTVVKLKNCKLISLNFSQPHGQPSTGIIYSTMKGPLLHVDLEDCLLMGYKVFGSGGQQFGCGARPDGGPISYTTKGRVQAYVQYRQAVPKGIERLRFWPVEAFESMAPPRPDTYKQK